ncbi:unnamed protein product, partial [Strongylus vulgaris]
ENCFQRKLFLSFRALSAGIKSPLLVTVPNPRYPEAELVSALGALLPLYTPLNVREEEPNKKFEQLGLLPIQSDHLLELVEAFEAAFTVCRDVGETGPERMSPPNVANYVKYPLMAAVNRDVKNTYMMVGKGVTIDTGTLLRSSDYAFGGHMWGMCRDNIGARAYTTDEVIKARSGKRIHIYNTDAEGRITMLDPLTRAKEEVVLLFSY